MLNATLKTLSATISKATDEQLTTILAEQCEAANAELLVSNERRLIDGMLTIKYVSRWKKKDGLEKLVDAMKANGRRSDKGYLVQCAFIVSYANDGVDLFEMGGERQYRPMFRLKTMDKDGNIGYKRTRRLTLAGVETAIQGLIEGTLTHKDAAKNDVPTTLESLTTSVIFDETFGTKKKASSGLNWSLKQLENDKEERIVSKVKKWFADMLKSGKPDDYEGDDYNNPVALKVAEAISSMLTPIATPTESPAKTGKAGKALAGK